MERVVVIERADRWSSLLEAGDDIVGREWGGSEISSRDSPSLEKSQSLQMSVNLLSIYEREDEDGDEGGGDSDGYA